MMPPAAASAEPMKKVMPMVRLMLIPIRRAASRSWAVARIARPTRVRWMNWLSAIINPSAIRMMKMLPTPIEANPRLRLPPGSLNLGFASIGVGNIFIILIALGLMIALNQFIQRTRVGRAMRATAQDRDAARLMGININRTIGITFFIGSALAAAGGIIYGFDYQTIDFSLGFRNGLVAFTAAVFGGIGNVVGAALGGFMIGIIIDFVGGYFQGGQQWSDVVVFSILILVLVFRPTGLLGMRVPEK